MIIMSEKKEDKLFYINHSGELLIWLIIILIMSVFYFVFNIQKVKLSNEYSLYMPDVDGLIVGSPVRAMGIEVGHVTKIKPIKDEVYVKFIITDKDVKLPQGTVVTVEFSGMAGSKSLELYLPNETTYLDSSVPLLRVNQPKRLHDAAGLLNEMFKKIGNIIIVSSRFGNNLSKIDFPKSNGSVDDAENFLKFANEIIDKSQQRAENLGRKLNNGDKK